MYIQIYSKDFFDLMNALKPFRHLRIQVTLENHTLSFQIFDYNIFSEIKIPTLITNITEKKVFFIDWCHLSIRNSGLITNIFFKENLVVIQNQNHHFEFKQKNEKANTLFFNKTYDTQILVQTDLLKNAISTIKSDTCIIETKPNYQLLLKSQDENSKTIISCLSTRGEK